DPKPELRQASIVDKDGKSVSFTGDACDTWNGHLTGDHFAVAGNMLIDEQTIQAAAKAFEDHTGENLAERLLIALVPGQAAGGDKRGRQSASLYLVDQEEYPLYDLRVDEHEDPVNELRRVYKVAEQQLFPLLGMLPTKANPAGTFDLDESRKLGILQDNE